MQLQTKVEEEKRHFVIEVPQKCETTEEWLERYSPKRLAEARKNSN